MYIITTAIGYFFGVQFLFLVLFLIMLQNVFGSQKLFDPVLKFICRAILLLFGIRVSVKGKRTRPEKAVIYIANHVNLFDLFILYGYLPGFVRGVELDVHFSWPVWGPITTRLGTIPISHTDTSKAILSLNIAADTIGQGVSIVILPEGRRTRDGNLQVFNKGPFRIAKHTGADIIPVAMKGAFQRKTVHSLKVFPGRVDLCFGRPIKAGVSAELSERELKDIARTRIEELLEEP